MFPDYKDGRRHPWNIVPLTARQHYVAHLLLWKAYRNRSTAFAVKNMLINNPYTDRQRAAPSRLVAQLREVTSIAGIPKSAEHRAKISAAHQGKKFNDETKERMSEAQRKRSPEAKAAAGLKHRGKTISAEMRAKQSAALAGEKNPRAMLWEIEWEDGRREQIKSMKSWCRERGFNYSTVYARLRNGDNEVYRDGFRVLGKSPT